MGKKRGVKDTRHAPTLFDLYERIGHLLECHPGAAKATWNGYDDESLYIYLATGTIEIRPTPPPTEE